MSGMRDWTEVRRVERVVEGCRMWVKPIAGVPRRGPVKTVT